MLVGIVLLTSNHLEWLKESVASIFRCTPPGLFKLHIFDNMSTDETPDFIKTLDCDYTLSKTYFSPGQAINYSISQLLNKYHPDYFCILHNDMLVTTGWLHILLDEIKDYPNCLWLGSASVISKNAIYIPHGEREYIADKLRNCFTLDANLCPQIIHSKVFTEIGFFDDINFPFEADDCDLIYRIIKSGYQVLGTNKSVIFHHWTMTRLSTPEARERCKSSRDNWSIKYPGISIVPYNYYKQVPLIVDGKSYIRHGV